MIEALIRDDKRLICLICIRPGPDKESLNVDIFIPSEGKTLSGVMPAGGEPAQQVARAVMTVYPISALSPAWTEARKDIFSTSPLDRRPEPGPESDRSEDERWAALRKKDLELDEREKKLDQDIKNLRKSHPAS